MDLAIPYRLNVGEVAAVEFGRIEGNRLVLVLLVQHEGSFGRLNRLCSIVTLFLIFNVPYIETDGDNIGE